ncbi:MAG: hypothetical protein JWO40_237 [Candidatus Doudnabacteria bacterium]|nr:hypothetical protein [Candidatus Doudnabacteria bacterium]
MLIVESKRRVQVRTRVMQILVREMSSRPANAVTRNVTVWVSPDVLVNLGGYGDLQEWVFEVRTLSFFWELIRKGFAPTGCSPDLNILVLSEAIENKLVLTFDWEVRDAAGYRRVGEAQAPGSYGIFASQRGELLLYKRVTAGLSEALQRRLNEKARAVREALNRENVAEALCQLKHLELAIDAVPLE